MRATAASLLDLLEARPPTLGTGRLLCVDGPAASGKTSLAAAVSALRPDAVVVHTDELLLGWDGLPGLADTVHALLDPLSRGGAGTWRRWDWIASAPAEEHVVEPGGVLVLEGTGCWSPAYAALVTALAWVEVEPAERQRRWLARDGEQARAHLTPWQRDEDALHARLGTRAHADVVIDGTE